MSDLRPYTAAGVARSRSSRRAAEAIQQQSLGADVRIAAANARTDVTLAKTENVTLATGAAMAAVVRVSQAQRQYEQLAPDAAGRLAFLADEHLLGMSDLLTQMRLDQRRC